MSTAPRILIFRLSSMGDVILCTSAIEAIRARAPEARITWVVAREFAQLLQGDIATASLRAITVAGRGRVFQRGLAAARRTLGRAQCGLSGSSVNFAASAETSAKSLAH